MDHEIQTTKTDSNLYTQLLNHLSGATPLESVLRLAAEQLQSCVYLVDFTGKMLGYALHSSKGDTGSAVFVDFSLDGFDMTRKPVIKNVWQAFCNRGYLDHTTCKKIFDPPYSPNYTQNQPLPVTECHIGDNDFILCPLPYRHKDFARLVIHTDFARLSVHSDFAHLSSHTDQNILSLQALDCLQLIGRALTFLIDQSPLPNYKNGRELLLFDFLQNASDTRQSVNERCKIIGIKAASAFQLMTICNSQNITDLPIFSITINKLSVLFPDAIFIIHNNRLVVLYENVSVDKTFAVNNGLDAFFSKYKLTAAVSLPFGHMYYVQQAYIQTLQALDEGLAIDYTDTLYLYQDYLPYHALSYVKNPKDFCHPCIQQLMAEDALHQTEYTKTLYTYIMNFRNQKDAAQQMNVHYNTMKYRLKKIQNFIDFSLDDHEEFLLLYLSFKLMKLNGHIF